jgi:spectinomycin phosphotransferase/16S rRNA (guanine(1405)-N(7))-methyltransferase
VVLTPPPDLPDTALVPMLAREWSVTVDSMAYRPLGFGSHHWEVTGTGATRWFLTADDLETGRHSLGEPLDAAYHRLRAALAAAAGLRDHGRSFVVAPLPTRDGEPLARVGDRFGVALYPFVEGQSFDWGEFVTPAHRHAVLELVISVHTAPEAVRRHAVADRFAIPHRDELEAALADPVGVVEDHGPYARPTCALLAEHAAAVRRLLDHYDRLVAQGRARPSQAVLTHGEPHPGNTMRDTDGWRLIDWDTARVAPPERDLWMLDPGDGSVLDAYAEATGVTPLPSMIELYRVRWDIADIAVEVSRFRGPHAGSSDDVQGWEILRSLVTGAPAT